MAFNSCSSTRSMIGYAAPHASHDAIVRYFKTVLLPGSKPGFGLFMGSGVFLNIFDKSRFSRIRKGESAVDDTPRDIIQIASICVDLRYRLSYRRKALPSRWCHAKVANRLTHGGQAAG
jgi:hypothetical protein